jgi:thymidylate synthase (FAD)
MSAKLVHSSQSTSQTETLQDMVAYCARVSNPANQHNQETNPKLLKYLIKNQHWSPFEMVSICLEIKTTRDIARQILRHRSFSFQEFSQRYAQVDESFVTREARLQDNKNRQNSISSEDQQLQTEWDERQQALAEQAKETYQWALEQGIAKEQARAVLPEGMTPSTLYMNGTLRSWIHYIQVRSEKATQKEHRALAVAAAEAIAPLFPLIEEFVSKE